MCCQILKDVCVFLIKFYLIIFFALPFILTAPFKMSDTAQPRFHVFQLINEITFILHKRTKKSFGVNRVKLSGPSQWEIM